MERTPYGYVLANGRKLNVYGGVIGLSERDGLTEGYDARIQRYQDGAYEELALEDKIEIASYVLGQWKRYLRRLQYEYTTKGKPCGAQ